MDSVFDRVRQIDPGLSEEAVQQYFREIDEVAAAIRSIDVSEVALPVAYSPAWQEETRS
jgi:hypothetical protein